MTKSKTYGGGTYGDYDDFVGHSSKARTYKRCYESHPILSLGGGKFIGGSCYSPAHKAEVYIGLDHGMQVIPWTPWSGDEAPIQVYFPITDMRAPSNPKEFQKLVDYVCNQLQAGKTVHAGCIGGHGRTGTLLAAVYSVVTGEKDAITKIRGIYCKKAVESSEQVTFLNSKFGITKVDGAKSSMPVSSTGGYSGYGGKSSWPSYGASELKPKKPVAFSESEFVWNAVRTTRAAVGNLI